MRNFPIGCEVIYTGAGDEQQDARKGVIGKVIGERWETGVYPTRRKTSPFRGRI